MKKEKENENEFRGEKRKKERRSFVHLTIEKSLFIWNLVEWIRMERDLNGGKIST